jgi:hypothetical protein
MDQDIKKELASIRKAQQDHNKKIEQVKTLIYILIVLIICIILLIALNYIFR